MVKYYISFYLERKCKYDDALQKTNLLNFGVYLKVIYFESEIVLISLYPGEDTFEERTFKEHITCRLVNKGTYKKIEEEKYHIDGDRKDFDIVLNKKELSFEVIIPKLNKGEPITLKKVGDIPVSYDIEYGDLQKYQEYLE